MAESLRCIGDKQKHVLASLGETPGAIYPEFFVWERTVMTYIPGFTEIRSGLGDITERPSTALWVNAI